MTTVRYKTNRHSGLSLVELVVVLAILAAMATAATVAADRVIMQQRFELSQQTLTSVRSAVLGKHAPGEATVGVNTQMEGFVADMGRLPVLVGTNPESQAAELWQNVGSMEPYDWKQSSYDPEVWLACGWRGPYLNLPVGQDRLIDGWGRPLIMLTYDASIMPAAGGDGDLLAGMISRGSDGEEGISPDQMPLSGDLTLWLGEQGPQWMTGISVTVWQRNSDGEQVSPDVEGTLTVRMFGPNPTDGSVAMIQAPPQTGPFATPPQATFAEIPIGTKVLRAYFEDNDGVTHKSVPLPIEVSRTGRSNWSLVLPTLESELDSGESEATPETEEGI